MESTFLLAFIVITFLTSAHNSFPKCLITTQNIQFQANEHIVQKYATALQKHEAAITKTKFRFYQMHTSSETIASQNSAKLQKTATSLLTF